MNGNKLNGIETVLLDLDGTVMDFQKGQRAAFYQACHENGVNVDDVLYYDFDATNKRFWKLFELGKIEKEVLVYERFYDLFGRFKIDADVIKFESIYQGHLGEQHFLIDGAFDGVKYLFEKYKIFVATNGVKVTQLNRLKESGLSEYAHKVCISEEIGYPKPQKEYFDKALEGVDRRTAAIIGDSMSSDIKGGINAGIKTVWFNPTGEKSTLQPTVEVKNWEEIYKIL